MNRPCNVKLHVAQKRLTYDEHANGWMNGWMGGSTWIWPVVGILVVVLMVVVINKLSKK